MKTRLERRLKKLNKKPDKIVNKLAFLSSSKFTTLKDIYCVQVEVMILETEMTIWKYDYLKSKLKEKLKNG